MLLTWKKLAELMVAMSEKDKAKPILFQDGNTGEMIGFESEINWTEEDEVPPNYPTLSICDDEDEYNFNL